MQLVHFIDFDSIKPALPATNKRGLLQMLAQGAGQRLGIDPAEIAAAVAERDRAQAQLGNEAFVTKAPDHVIEVQRRRLATAEEQVSLL